MSCERVGLRLRETEHNPAAILPCFFAKNTPSTVLTG